MKNKFVLILTLLGLALVSAACAAQEADTDPGAATPMETVSTGDNTAVAEETGEVAETPTAAAESGTPAQGSENTGTTPTVSAEGGTPSQGTGDTAVIPQTGPGDAGLPDDLDEAIRVLRETGATVEMGEAVEQDFLTIPGQSIMINGEEVQIFTFSSAEELEAQASQLDGNPEDEPHFYKMGSMLVRYAGSDPGVRDLLEDVLGAQAAGQ